MDRRSTDLIFNLSIFWAVGLFVLFFVCLGLRSVAMQMATTDPAKIIYGGGVCPLGGAEETAGYKGYP